MQQLSNAALFLALTVFVTAGSLVRVAVSWLIAAQLLTGPARLSLPGWLFMGVLVIGFRQASAQTSAPDAYEVVDAYVKPINSVSGSVAATNCDTLRSAVRPNVRLQNRRITPKPAWPSEERPEVRKSMEPDPSSVFYIMAIEPNPSAYKPGYWRHSQP